LSNYLNIFLIFPFLCIYAHKYTSTITYINISGIDSTEVLENNVWRYGPSLKVSTWDGKMVSEPRGGVILIGGNANLIPTSALYYLKDADATTQWILLTQTLSNPIKNQVAFLIPDIIANCTIP